MKLATLGNSIIQLFNEKFCSSRMEYSGQFIRKSNQEAFNQRGGNIFYILYHLMMIVLELKKFKKSVAPGNVITYPSFITKLCWWLLIPFNPGNLGNWSIRGKQINNVTGAIEYAVIKWLISLYRTEISSIEGYFTCGATEANIFSAWLGRARLTRQLKDKNAITLVYCDLSHYSVKKAANVVGVPSVRVDIRSDWQGTDTPSLRRLLHQQYTQGVRGFLIPLTLGFTLTGTDDNIAAIISVTNSFKEKFPDSHFFIWIDAALAGLVQPFTKPPFAPFGFPQVQTVAVDYHKFWKVPIPAGQVLYRKELRKLIEQPISYLTENDNTLLGSRTGISPVAVWANIEFLGKKGLSKMVHRNMIQKNIFIETYKKHSELEIITSQYNLNLAVIIHKNKTYWSEYFCKKYNIVFKNILIKFATGEKKLLIGKAYFIQE